MTKEEALKHVVMGDGLNIRFMPFFDDDKDVVLAAVKNNSSAFNHINVLLKNDRDVALAVVKGNSRFFKDLGEGLRGDKKIALVAVKNNGRVIEFASDELRDDKEVALAAVKRSGTAVKFLSLRLKDDKEVALAAVKSAINEGINECWSAFNNISKRLRDDKEVALVIININTVFFYMLGDNAKNDRDVVKYVVKKDGFRVFKFIDNKFKNDKEIVLLAINRDGCAYEDCSELMQRDYDVIRAANNNLKSKNLSVDNFLCGKLKELKEKYGVSFLIEALEMEAAEMEVKRLSDDVTVNVKKIIKGRV